MGRLEVRLRFTAEDGTVTDTTTTPSDWGLADKWADTLRREHHTEPWVSAKTGQAVYVLAAQREGLVPKGKLSVIAIAELLNAFDVEEIPDAVEGEGENPSQDGQEGDREAS